MASTKVEQRNLPQLLSELDEKGALNVRRGPADFAGRVIVTWDDPADLSMTEEEYRQNMLAYLPVYILGGLIAALMVAVMVIVSL